MTNAEFQNYLEGLYEKHSLIAKSRKKTFNELAYVLRQDNVEYNISIPPYKEDMGWLCIPSVKWCFIPVSTLAMHVKAVELEEMDFEEDDDFEYDGICLTVWLEE